MLASHICRPLACKEADVPDAITAPIFSLLFRQKPRFLAELIISGMSSTLFAFALDSRSDVIESIAANEMSWVKRNKEIVHWQRKILGMEPLNANQPGIYETILTKGTRKTLIRIRGSVCGDIGGFRGGAEGAAPPPPFFLVLSKCVPILPWKSFYKMLFDSVLLNVNVTLPCLLCITNTPTMLYASPPEFWKWMARLIVPKNLRLV